MLPYLLFFLGILIGVALAKALMKPKHAGILRVYDSEPDEPANLFLELDTSVENVMKKEYVTFRVTKIHV